MRGVGSSRGEDWWLGDGRTDLFNHFVSFALEQRCYKYTFGNGAVAANVRDHCSVSLQNQRKEAFDA